MGEGSIPIIVLVYGLHLLYRCVAACIGCYENASGKTSTLGDEEHLTIVLWLQLMDGLIYLMQMLMREGLVDGDIVVAPGEMSGCTWFLSCSCTSGDAVGVYVTADNPCFQCRQESQLDAGGKASGIGQMHARAYFLPVSLGQSVHIVVLSCYTEVLSLYLYDG